MNIDDYMTQLKILVQLNLDKAGAHLVEKCKAKINRPNPTGQDPSGPGEPPKKITGELQDSIGYRQTGDFTVEVFSDSKHAIPLEYGTSKMAARPFLRPTMAEEQQAVLDILGGTTS